MKIDPGIFAGLLVGIGGIIAGLVLEGGTVTEILQPTAALIVFGGTLGATLISQPFPVVWGAAKQFLGVFRDSRLDLNEVIDQVVDLAQEARRNGIISLEKKLSGIPDRFMRKAVTLAVDGTESKDLREIMEVEIQQESTRREAEAKVLEAAGGYAPTIGIIGAVLGLIQVMKHLENIEEVGRGIAVAFVATIYGVGIANIVLLPGARRMAGRIERNMIRKELMLEGIICLTEGLNPRLIRFKLGGYLDSDKQVDQELGGTPAGAPAIQHATQK
jgi:chemotaxis protein MotA